MTTRPASHTCRVSSCTNPALYTCPRCSLPYCSVSCYTAHSQPCLDAFAEHAIHPLRGLTTSPAHRRSFNHMLERIRNQTDPPYVQTYAGPDLDSGDESDHICETARVQTPHHPHTNPESHTSDEPHVLEQLLHSLDEPATHALFTVLNSAMENAATHHPPPNSHSCDNPSDPVDEPKPLTHTLEMLVEEMETFNLSYNDIFSRLPHSLRNDFEKRLRDGSVQHFVLPWTPWWQHSDPTAETNLEHVQQQPAPLPRLPLSSHLLVPLHVPPQKASLCLRYSLIDILAAYALSMRLCNGDWWGDAFAATSVWRISTVLSRDARYTSVNDVCVAVSKTIVQEENHSLAMQVLRDVADILSGSGDWVARALYECQCVLEGGLKVAGSGKGEIRKRIRKVGFFVAWSMSQESEVFEQLARKVLSFTELESGLAEEVKIAARVAEARRTPKITILE